MTTTCPYCGGAVQKALRYALNGTESEVGHQCMTCGRGWGYEVLHDKVVTVYSITSLMKTLTDIPNVCVFCGSLDPVRDMLEDAGLSRFSACHTCALLVDNDDRYALLARMTMALLGLQMYGPDYWTNRRQAEIFVHNFYTVREWTTSPESGGRDD